MQVLSVSGADEWENLSCTISIIDKTNHSSITKKRMGTDTVNENSVSCRNIGIADCPTSGGTDSTVSESSCLVSFDEVISVDIVGDTHMSRRTIERSIKCTNTHPSRRNTISTGVT
jgi:hypothetical protein